MWLDRALLRWNAMSLALRLAVVVWVGMTLAVCVRIGLRPQKQTVYPVWKHAGHDWRTGHDLYEDRPGSHHLRFGYRYSPLIAGFFTLADLVPERIGNVVWRLINVGVFLAAVLWWLESGVPLATTGEERGWLLLLMAPLSLGSLNNGQVNLLLAGLMLACLTGVAVGRWNLASLCAAAAIFLKIYPVALALLVAVVYPRRFVPRLVLALLVLFGVSFLLQDPDYVARQYVLWWERIRHNDSYRRYWALTDGYRDFWLLVRLWRLPVNLHQYTMLQLGGGFACAVATGLATWRLGQGKQVLFVLLQLATGWMLLLGPSPESCTYALFAAPLAWWLLHSRRANYWAAHYLAVFGYGLLQLCVLAGSHSTGISLYHGCGLQPIAVLAILGGFLPALAVWMLAAPAAVEHQGSPADPVLILRAA